MSVVDRIQGWGIGALIALVVLILCIVLWFIGAGGISPNVLLLIGLLALARLL